MAVNSQVIDSNLTFTRPANTTAYADGDAITDSASSPSVLEFENVGSGSSQFVEITNVILTTTAAAAAPGVELWLFDTTFTAVNDNSAFTLTDAENLTVVAVVPIGNKFAATNNGFLQSDDLTKIVKLGEGTSLYGMLVATASYTPANAEVFDITLFAKRH